MNIYNNIIIIVLEVVDEHKLHWFFNINIRPSRSRTHPYSYCFIIRSAIPALSAAQGDDAGLVESIPRPVFKRKARVKRPRRVHA